MAKNIYPKDKEPKCLLAGPISLKSDKKKEYFNEISNFFENELRVHVNKGEDFIEGYFNDADNRKVTYRFYFKEIINPFTTPPNIPKKNASTSIEGDVKSYNIRTFRKLYEFSQNIPVSTRL